MTFWLIILGAGLGGLAWCVSLFFHARRRVVSAMGWGGFAIGLAACILLAPTASAVGTRMAKDNILTFNEFLNGYETDAIHEVQPCGEDGACRHVYDCHPYDVQVAHTSTDSKGNSTTYYTTETHYHSCPYVTEEWTFKVKTSLKTEVVISASGFATNPVSWDGRGIPGGVFQGIPPFWAAAKQRIESGNPGPVTVTSTYKNYILASQNSILRQYGSAVDDFKAKNQLPKLSSAQPNSGIRDFYHGSKAYFVQGLANQDAWTAQVNTLASALGTDLQGDLNVVFVDKGVDKDSYKHALQAYWTGPEFEKNSLSKNGLVLIIGVDGSMGRWVRAFTGMPGGNEGLIVELEGLKDLNLSDPSTILGSPRGKINAERKVKEIEHSNGKIESILWGQHKFKRVCMVCEGSGDSGQGFTYLDDAIEPSEGQIAIITAVASLFYLVIWGLVIYFQIPSPNITTTYHGRKA